MFSWAGEGKAGHTSPHLPDKKGCASFWVHGHTAGLSRGYLFWKLRLALGVHVVCFLSTHINYYSHLTTTFKHRVFPHINWILSTNHEEDTVIPVLLMRKWELNSINLVKNKILGTPWLLNRFFYLVTGETQHTLPRCSKWILIIPVQQRSSYLFSEFFLFLVTQRSPSTGSPSSLEDWAMGTGQ